MIAKRLSISEFKARCTEEIRGLEKGGPMIELTRHGKRVAVVQSPADAAPPAGLESWIGTGKGTVTYGGNHDPAAPAWDPVDWED